MNITLSDEMTRTLLRAVKIAKFTSLKELGDSPAGMEVVRKLEDAETMLNDMLMYRG